MDHGMTRASLKTLLLLMAVVLLVGTAQAKRKDDVVIMKNGDSFTGDNGELVFKSDYMKDSVHLDWKRVKSLRSKDPYIVSVKDGRRLTGNIERSVPSEGNPFDFVVVEQKSPTKISSMSIIRIQQQQEVSF